MRKITRKFFQVGNPCNTLGISSCQRFPTCQNMPAKPRLLTGREFLTGWKSKKSLKYYMGMQNTFALLFHNFLALAKQNLFLRYTIVYAIPTTYINPIT